MEERHGKDQPGEWRAVRRGWFLGSGQLKEQLLERMWRAGSHHGGVEKQETDEQKAERFVVGELKKRGWTEQELERRRKTDTVKVKLAAQLRAQSVMTMDWIAQRLRMGCRHTVANCLRRRITERAPLDRCPPTHGGCDNATNRFLSVCASQTRHAYRRTPESGQNGGERLKVSSK